MDDSRKTSDMKAEGLRYHYFKKYADSERLLTHPHHNFKMEGDVLKALVDANVVTLCTKEKDSTNLACLRAYSLVYFRIVLAIGKGMALLSLVPWYHWYHRYYYCNKRNPICAYLLSPTIYLKLLLFWLDRARQL